MQAEGKEDAEVDCVTLSVAMRRKRSKTQLEKRKRFGGTREKKRRARLPYLG